MFGHGSNAVSGSNTSSYNCYRLNNMASNSRSSSPALRSMSSGRKGSKKVRTGCVTCKIRKVKCDETKPFCLRCTKTGRKCDGYLDPRALTKRRGPRDVAPHDHALGSLFEFAAPEEKRAFWFFQHCTAPCISGDFDADFWRAIVLQISQTEPAVRHAVLAVSSLHEGLGTGFSDDALSHPHQSFALQQYNKAISRLLDQMNNPLTKPLASLLTCVLFVCIEYMQGKDKESLIHLEQGRQLLTQLNQRSSDPEMDCIVRHIVPLYTRLSLTSFLFGGSPVPIPDALKSQSDIPATFDSMDSMRHSMHDFMEQAFRFTKRARPAKNPNDSIPRETMRLLEVEQDRLLSRQAKLNVAFSLFRASKSNPGPQNSLLVLQMYLHAQHIWISTALSSSEVVYDDFLSSFAAIVPLAAAYLDLESSSQNRSLYSPHFAMPESLSVSYNTNFTFETHIIPPLYYVVTKCRHPLIRRSALHLLRRNPYRRENLWRASVMGALARHIVSLEEQWSQKHSPSTMGSLSNTDNISRNTDGRLEQTMRPHILSHETGLYSTSIGTEQAPTMASITNVSALTPTLSFEAPREPTSSKDTEVPSIMSHSPSLAASVDDGYSSRSIGKPKMAFLSPPNSSNTWHWQQALQNPQPFQLDAYPAGQIGYTTSNIYETIQAQTHSHMGHGSVDYSSQSGDSSEVSSVDLEDQRQYQAILQGHTPPQQYPYQAAYQQSTQLRGTTMGAHQQRHQEPLPANIITEAPFGLPEELRVHDAIVGPEREDGTWVAVFRKLHGVDADWDVQNDWVSTI